MAAIIPFTFDSKQIRVTDQNGDPWFVLRDLLEAMASKTKSTDAVDSINQGLGEGFVNDVPLQTAGGTQKVIIVAEPAATYLLSRSNTEKGRELNRFIHVEILPSLRKTGAYQIDPPKPKRKRAPSQLSGKLFIARQIRSVLRVSDTSYIGMVAKIAESEGIEPTFLPAYVDETLTKAMTGMLKDLDHRLATKVRSVVHPALEEMGILERLSRPSTTKPGQVSRFLSLTTEGLKYGRNETSPNNPRETQPLYYVDRFGDLLKRLEAHLQRRPANLTLAQDADPQEGGAA